MPPKEYWEGNPYLIWDYEDAYEIQKATKNEELWRQGLYNYRAFSSVINMFGWGLGGKKGECPEGYIEYPIPVTEIERKEEEQREIEKTLKFFEDGQKEEDFRCKTTT